MHPILNPFSSTLYLLLFITGAQCELQAATSISGSLKLFASPGNTNAQPFRTAEFVFSSEGCKWDLLLTNFTFQAEENQRALHFSSDCEAVVQT